MRQLTLLFAAVSLAAPLGAQQAPASRARADLRFLASDKLEGRLTGSPGARAAAEYVQRRFRQAGLQAPEGGWFQEFTVHADALGAKDAGIAGATGRNVLGLLRGTDPALRDEVIVVGAHYDHLGLGGSFALDSVHAIHNGADDNASGTTALFRIAELLRAAGTRRSVLFIAFAGEEEGLLGSAYYVRHPVLPLERTVAMVNLDMVGRLRNDKLIVYGTATAPEFPALLDSLNAIAKFDLRRTADGFGPSDQSSFYGAKKPVLMMFTDLHEDYHRATDDWEKINVPGLLRVAEFTAGVVRALADRPVAVAYAEVPASHGTMAAASGQPGVPSGSRSSGYGAYLGTIPDMAGGLATGVRLSGVRSGSPAEQAGLRADDVLLRIGEHEVTDLQAMTDALRSYKPGERAPLTYERNGQQVTVEVTFGQRGG